MTSSMRRLAMLLAVLMLCTGYAAAAYVTAVRVELTILPGNQDVGPTLVFRVVQNAADDSGGVTVTTARSRIVYKLKPDELAQICQ